MFLLTALVDSKEILLTFLKGTLALSVAEGEETMSWGTDLWVSMQWGCVRFIRTSVSCMFSLQLAD